MSDTPKDIEALYRNLLMACSGERRMLMGCSMFDTAKEFAKAGICAENPGLDDVERSVALFLRCYGNDFSEEERRFVIAEIRKRRKA